MTNSGTEKEGGGAAGWDRTGGEVWAGLLVFLVGAALLTLVGLVAEAGVVESRPSLRPPLAAPGLGERRRPLSPPGILRRNGEGDWREFRKGDCMFGTAVGGGSGLHWGMRNPELVATLYELLRCLEGPWVDQIADVARQFAKEKGGLCILYRLQLQGGEVVPQDGGPGVAAHGIIQPLVGHLLGAEAVGSQEELLQLLVRVADVGGITRQRTDGGDQRER